MKDFVTDEQRDLRLLSELVDKALRQRGSSAQPPLAYCYQVRDADTRGEPGRHLRLGAWLGRDFTVELRARWGDDADRDVEHLVSIADDCARVIDHLHSDLAKSRGILREVRAAARRQIGKANCKGLPYRLIRAEPAPIAVEGHAGLEVTLTIEMLGEALLPIVRDLRARSAADVLKIFAREDNEQAKRAAIRKELEESGATGFIDPILLAALRVLGVDLGPVLKRLGASGGADLDVATPAGEQFRLHWKDGVVQAHLDLGGGVAWFGDRLVFDTAPAGLSDSLIGRSIVNLFEHECLPGAVLIQAVDGTPGGRATVHCHSMPLLFDSSAEQVW